MTPPYILSLRERRRQLQGAPLPIQRKRCVSCHTRKPLTDFPPSTNPHRVTGKTCLACQEAQRETRRRASLRKQHKLSIEDYNELLKRQGYACAICGITVAELAQSEKKHKYLAVDHDHVTGAIRGLLCDMCNHGLGFFRDTTAFLEAAIAYLERQTGEHII